MEGEPSAKRVKTEAPPEAPPAKPEGESVVERVRHILPKACALRDLLDSVDRVRETAAADAAAAAAAEAARAVDRAQRAAALDRKFACAACGNRDQTLFVTDNSGGDTICRACGVVVEQKRIHEGSMYRKFEGEEDRNHHGPAPNPLYSHAHNMRTQISMTTKDGAPLGPRGGQASADAYRLKTTQESMELNLSNMGRDDRRTRTEYKDEQKREAFDLLTHMCAHLKFHDAVGEKAKELFAHYRDARQHVHHFETVLGACLVLAHDIVAQAQAHTAAAAAPTVMTHRQKLLRIRKPIRPRVATAPPSPHQSPRSR